MLLVTTQVILTAQISVKSTPKSFNNLSMDNISTVHIPNIVPSNRVTANKSEPLQAGYTLMFNHNLNVGEWDKTGDAFIWRLQVIIPDAAAVNLYFDDINMSVGDELFLYDSNKNNVLGAFTSLNNGTYMCTDFIIGDKIIIEYNTKNNNHSLPFSLHEIGVLFADELNNSRGFGDAGNCEVFVNCDEGADWQNQKDGVARVLVKQSSSTFWCTGSLINNTKNDGKPYFLTANHCGESADSIDYAQWLFYFNFESASCNQPLFEPESNTISGSTMLAHANGGTDSGSDFKLLLLKNRLPISYRPYYNGWDVTGEASPSGVGIHHPQGDIKMISTYLSPLQSAKYNSQTPNPDGHFWMVHWDETTSGHGVTEGGSSGSPIFSNKGYIVGALTGGYASCTNLNSPDYYGKLSYSWKSNGNDSTSQLSYWLDPNNSGIEKLKGNNLDSTNIFAGFSAEPKSILMGESVEFINTSYGNISAYSWYFEGGDPEYSEQANPPNVKYPNAGIFDVRLVVASAEGHDTLLIKDYISVLPNISPNPCHGTIRLAFGGTKPDDLLNSIRVFNSVGKEIGYRIVEERDDYIIIEILPKKAGYYLVKISSKEVQNTFKIIVLEPDVNHIQ